MTLSERRKKQKLTQEDVAKKLGIDRTTVSKWETGETFPSTKQLLPLAKLYNCKADDLLSGVAPVEA